MSVPCPAILAASRAQRAEMELRAIKFTGAGGRLRGTLWMGVLESDEHEKEAEVGTCSSVLH